MSDAVILDARTPLRLQHAALVAQWFSALRGFGLISDDGEESAFDLAELRTEAIRHTIWSFGLLETGARETIAGDLGLKPDGRYESV